MPWWAAAQSLLGHFEQLALGPGGPTAPGQPPETAADPAAYPRPLGSDAGDPPPPPDPRNCDPAFMRATVVAIPSTPALKARCDMTWVLEGLPGVLKSPHPCCCLV